MSNIKTNLNITTNPVTIVGRLDGLPTIGNYTQLVSNLSISVTGGEEPREYKTILKYTNSELNFKLVEYSTEKKTTIAFSKFFNANYDTALIWSLLGSGGNEQIHPDRLSNALGRYALNSDLINASAANATSLEAHVSNTGIHLTYEEKSFLDSLILNGIPSTGGGGGGTSDSLWLEDADGNLYPRPKDDSSPRGIWTSSFISAGGKSTNTSGGSGGGGGFTTFGVQIADGTTRFNEETNNFVNIPSTDITNITDSIYATKTDYESISTTLTNLANNFNKMFAIVKDENNVESIQAKLGLWTNEYLSAGGHSTNNEGGTGGGFTRFGVQVENSPTFYNAEGNNYAIIPASAITAITDSIYQPQGNYASSSALDLISASLSDFKRLFDSMFVLEGDGENKSIKALYGLWTDSYLSAGGKSEESGSTGGLTVFNVLLNGQTYTSENGSVTLPDYPTKLPNPQPLTIKSVLNNNTIASYDGSVATDVTLHKEDVGLNNVDNTPDSEKEVKSATQLKTIRKIWGNDFDGTQNVDGSIKLGEATISYDADNDCIRVDKSFVSDKAISAGGVSNGEGGTGGLTQVTIRVNDMDYTSVNGTVTLPDYPTPPTIGRLLNVSTTADDTSTEDVTLVKTKNTDEYTPKTIRSIISDNNIIVKSDIIEEEPQTIKRTLLPIKGVNAISVSNGDNNDLNIGLNYDTDVFNVQQDILTIKKIDGGLI